MLWWSLGEVLSSIIIFFPKWKCEPVLTITNFTCAQTSSNLVIVYTRLTSNHTYQHLNVYELRSGQHAEVQTKHQN